MGGGYLVTDSGGNDLVHTTKSGHVSRAPSTPPAVAPNR